MQNNYVASSLPTIFNRLYHRFEDLIPHIASLHVGDSFFAPPRQPGDLAVYCSVSSVDGFLVEVEVAQDHFVGTDTQPSPWMVFRLDHLNQSAELLVIQDEFKYEVIYTEANRISPRRLPMNLYALNWLNVLYHIQFAFQPVETIAASNLA